MHAFRGLLFVIFSTIAAYTVFVVAEHGIGLFSVFFGDIRKVGWPGQFNLDFLGLLILSGFWLAWRNHFSPVGLLLGIGGGFLGAPFLTAYLLFVSYRCGGDVREMLLGAQRARA